MDYPTAENQALQLQTQANQVLAGLKTLADKLQNKVADPSLARELGLDLREAALAIQSQNQSTLALIEQMAAYIHQLETHVSTQAPGFQTGGWAAQPYGGGGFMNNVVQGAGLGAGFGLASDLVGSLFRAF